jgi:nucleoside-diphosphate-sugar epimerase
MRVALTGASGFIGSYTARALHQRGHRVRALVRQNSRRDHIGPTVAEWVVGEQHEPKAHRELVDSVDAVIHNAVDWGVRDDAVQNFEKNVLGSLKLLEAARASGVRQFLFVSSVAAYHEILPDRPLDENHPTWPAGLYGAYKAAIEPHLKAYHYSFGMNTSAWRPAAVYGIDPNLKRSQWFEIVDKVRRGEPISIAQGGKITHVQDVADALTIAIGDESTAGQFYTLVDRHIYWQQVAEIAKEITGSGSIIDDKQGKGPKNNFDTRKAIALFDKHGNRVALRRGLDGVREYVAELLKTL